MAKNKTKKKSKTEVIGTDGPALIINRKGRRLRIIELIDPLEESIEDLRIIEKALARIWERRIIRRDRNEK